MSANQRMQDFSCERSRISSQGELSEGDSPFMFISPSDTNFIIIPIFLVSRYV